MKRYKRVWILVCILVVCCIAAFAVTKIEEQKEQIRNSEDVILAVTNADVQSVSWEQGESALGFHRDDNGVWRWDDDEAFPVDDEAMADLLSIFEAFSTAFAIEEVEDYSQYGLDEPECTISLATADASYTVTLGAFSKMDEQRYVDIGDGNVYLVSTDPMDTYDVEISDLIDHDEIPVFDTVDGITFTGSDGYTLSYKEDSTASYCADDVYYWDSKPLDTDNVDTYLHNLSYMELSDYVSYNATEEELTTYGLAEPALSVVVDYTVVNEDETETASSFTIHIGVVTEEAEDEDAEPTTTAYARVGDSPILYKLAKDDETSILAYTYDDLRHADVFTADFETVTAIDITLEGATYNLVTAPSTDEDADEDEIVWMYGEEEIDVTGIRSKLNSLSADSFTTEAAAGKEEIRIVLHMENDHSDTMEIVLYRQDGTNCLCEVNGVSTALIPRSSVVDLIEAVNAIVLN